MFQPFIPGESRDLLQDQFSVFATMIREVVEELYGVEELETGDGRPDCSTTCLNAAMRPLLYTRVGETCWRCATRSARSGDRGSRLV
jgi:hypothetical protein